MKISAQEEYGLRCLLQLAERRARPHLTIEEISLGEGISAAYAAKLMRLLRQSGFVRSVRGQTGGYRLARSPERIRVADVLAALGGRLAPPDFCSRHAGEERVCPRYTGCQIRTLWRGVEKAVDEALGRTTLAELARARLKPAPALEPPRAAARVRPEARPAAPKPA